MAQSATQLLWTLLTNAKTAAVRRRAAGLASDSVLKKLSKLHQPSQETTK